MKEQDYTLYIRRSILNSMWYLTGSQWKCCNNGVMWRSGLILLMWKYAERTTLFICDSYDKVLSKMTPKLSSAEAEFSHTVTS